MIGDMDLHMHPLADLDLSSRPCPPRSSWWPNAGRGDEDAEPVRRRRRRIGRHPGACRGQPGGTV